MRLLLAAAVLAIAAAVAVAAALTAPAEAPAPPPVLVAVQPTPAPTPTATPAPAPQPPTPTPDPRPAVAVLVRDEAERSRLAAALAATGFAVTDDADAADFAIADAPRADAVPIVVARWAAVTDQRRDVLDLAPRDVPRILRGEVADWSELGGEARPIRALLPASQAALVASTFGIPPGDLAAETLPDGEVADRVAATPGAFALIAPEQLRLGVLALTVGGHDPYRDPARDSPLRLTRWISAPGAAEAAAIAVAAGLDAAPPFDPAGMLATGELIPVRCTNAALDAGGDHGAMFDGVRDAIAAADLAVSPLEPSLTGLGAPTPCVATFTLQGDPRAVDAMADAGIDVALTVGNHMMDCWTGCGGAAALLDTLERLRAAGIATAGAGADIDEARAPAVVSVETATGPVRFAFLGYDSIATWNAAGPGVAGVAPLDAASVREDVRAALDVADHVVVGAGWGEEYTADPTPFQREIAAAAVEAGATFVLGIHPHWVQAVEHLDGALVTYSLGNFVFDQSWSVETTQGMALELGFTAERLIGYRIRPVVIRGDGGGPRWIFRPEFVDPAAEGRPILDRVWDAQDRLPAR